jgi:hypothetical protein
VRILIRLLTFITSKLNEITPKVYLEQAPAKTPFPYVVFNLPNSDEAEFREDFVLEVDVWDKSPDTTALETLTVSIDQALSRLKHLDTNFQASFYRVSRLMLPDDDPTIRRRQLRYQVKAYLL